MSCFISNWKFGPLDSPKNSDCVHINFCVPHNPLLSYNFQFMASLLICSKGPKDKFGKDFSYTVSLRMFLYTIVTYFEANK